MRRGCATPSLPKDKLLFWCAMTGFSPAHSQRGNTSPYLLYFPPGLPHTGKDLAVCGSFSSHQLLFRAPHVGHEDASPQPKTRRERRTKPPPHTGGTRSLSGQVASYDRGSRGRAGPGRAGAHLGAGGVHLRLVAELDQGDQEREDQAHRQHVEDARHVAQRQRARVALLQRSAGVSGGQGRTALG